jgi:hypothetical protein
MYDVGRTVRQNDNVPRPKGDSILPAQLENAVTSHHQVKRRPLICLGRMR